MNELSCQTALPALHRYVDGECARAERTAVEVHLASCADCRMTLRSLRREADLLSQVASPDEPPADLFERIQVRLPSRRAMFFIRHRSALVAAAAVLVLAVLGLVAGQWLDGVQPPMAVVYTTGQPQARPTDADPWQPVRGEQGLPAGALVRATGGRSATLEFQDWTQLTLRADATVALLGQRRGAPHWWRLDSGELWAVFGQGRFRVDTAAGSLGGEGCEITVKVSGRRQARAGGFWPAAYAEEPGEIPRATFVVVRGRARAWNGHGSVEVHSGMETRLEPGRAPMAPRPADLAAVLAWTQPTTVASAPAAPAIPGMPPVGVSPVPVEEATVARPSITPPRIAVPAPDRPPIVVEAVEGPPPGPPAAVRAEALVGGTVHVTWEPPATGAPPVAYKVWRKAEGDDSYKQITIPPLAAAEPGERLGYPDHDIAQGMTYAYRVSAVDALDREGALGAPVTVTAQDFVLSYRGGSADTAVIYVTRRVGDSWVTHPFHVRARGKGGSAGAIGGPVRKSLGRGPQTVDFRTGYTLVDIVEERHPGTGRPSRRLILQDAKGRTQKVWLAITRKNGH